MFIRILGDIFIIWKVKGAQILSKPLKGTIEIFSVMFWINETFHRGQVHFASNYFWKINASNDFGGNSHADIRLICRSVSEKVMERGGLESVVYGQDPYPSKSCEDEYVLRPGERLDRFQSIDNGCK